ncbi:MAG: hypothetical protein U1E70_21550 [Acetobacteraceae bacterium]
MTVPFDERTLDSFADEIIVRAEPAADGRWRAVLDVGLWRFNGDPEFASTDTSREAAVARCAQTIRDDARGIGRYAPHTLLSPKGYDFRFRLCRHWVTKEHLRDLGHDPNQYVLDVDTCLERGDRWKLKGGFLDWSKESRLFEAGYRVALADLQASLRRGADLGEAVEVLWDTMAVVKTNLKRTLATEETWDLLHVRVAAAVEAMGFSWPPRSRNDVQQPLPAAPVWGTQAAITPRH